jgi:DAK2 domain fusion protein YloV
MGDPSVERFHRVVAVAHAHLEERREEINDLNVFPVADGDTGDNMAGTIKAVLEALENLRTSSLAVVDRNLVVTTVAHAALMGARGNSGVILSQIVRGAAETLTTRRGDLIGPALVRDALGAASDAAWSSVGDPQEGTMLTVIREIHTAVADRVGEMERTELPEDVSESDQDAMLAELMTIAITAGLTALERTPQQLEVLADAGVVDAGAYGLIVILAGLVVGLSGAEGVDSPIPHQAGADLTAGLHVDSRFQFCTSCIVTGRGLDPSSIVPRLEELGDSIAVVGDATMLKVHVHTDDRDRVRAICEEYGDVDQFEAADMHKQIAARHSRESAPAGSANGARTGVVAVASGDGIAELFGAEGANVVDGGSTLNPSIQEILAAIDAAPGEEVIVLPNSPNVIMAAREAARLAQRPAHVVESTAQQAGLAALVGAFDPTAPAGENASRLDAELAAIVTGLVAEADRDDADGRYARGDAVGFVGGELVAWGDPVATLTSVLDRLAADAEIVTVLEGADAPLPAASAGIALANGAELEIQHGGQPTYWWLIAAQ